MKLKNESRILEKLGTGKSARLLVAIAILAVCLAVFQLGATLGGGQNTPEVITVSNLEKIVNVSRMSTFTAVYNGIAEVRNDTNPHEIDYYVSYEAKVNAGIDLEQVEIRVEDASKTVYVLLPEVYITESNVDIASMDFIFYNDKANTSTVSQEAYKACEADVEKESKQQNAIIQLAEQNARNALTALIQPLLEQSDIAYRLVVE